MTAAGDRAKAQCRTESAGRGHGRKAAMAPAESGLLRSCFLSLLAALLLTACASVPNDYPRTESTAFQDHASIAIGKEVAALAAQNPGQSGFALLRRGRKDLVDRGVRIRIVTNSLASNDVVSAFAGYSLSREALIRVGVEPHELRWEPAWSQACDQPPGARTGLHTKTLGFDRKDVFIGSFNLDARSSEINTEAGLYIESPELAAQVIECLDTGGGPNSQLSGVAGRGRRCVLGGFG